MTKTKAFLQKHRWKPDRRPAWGAGFSRTIRRAGAGSSLCGLDLEQSQPGPVPALSGLGVLPPQRLAPAVSGRKLQCHLPLPHQHFVHRFHPAAGRGLQAAGRGAARAFPVLRAVGAVLLCHAGRSGPGAHCPHRRRAPAGYRKKPGQRTGRRGAGAVPGAEHPHVCPHGAGRQLAGAAGPVGVAVCRAIRK